MIGEEELTLDGDLCQQLEGGCAGHVVWHRRPLSTSKVCGVGALDILKHLHRMDSHFDLAVTIYYLSHQA